MSDIPKSCLTCPSYLMPGAESISKFKKSLGAPMCGRFGHVLGKPGLPSKHEQKLAQHYAQNCPSFGEPLPPLPLEVRLAVAVPDTEAREAFIREDLTKLCTSCAQCKNFIGEATVSNELGWTAGLCAAKGKLIMMNRQVYEARDCEYRQWGTVRNTTVGIHLFPEYEDAFQLNVDPVKSYFKNKGTLIEPYEYPSDKDVSEEDVEKGVRAWRKVADPDGSGNEAYLPIYNIDYFSEIEQGKIPRTGNDEHPELYVDHFGGVYLAAVAWTELDETPAVWGEAGTGKTEMFRHLAWLMCLPFERISITAQTELDDLAGKTHFSPDKGTFFTYGRLPLAWGKPCVIVIDEPNVGQPDVWQFLRPLTDNSKQLVLDMNAGERVQRHDDCYMGMAMNPAWSPLNVGASVIGDADASRLFHVFIDMPPASLEREIIKNRVHLDNWEITEDQLIMLMNVATEVRALCKDGTLPMTWGIRPQIKVARALRWFDPITAYRRAVGDYLEPESQASLLDVVRAHVERL